MIEIEHRTAKLKGVEIHYAGAGKGPLILFLHGFPELWRMWRRQLEEFGKTHLAVAPDLVGYNLSSKPEGMASYTLKSLVENVKDLAESLVGDQKFVLVGHDWGGAIAWMFAVRYPEKLDKLVVLNAPHPAIFQRELRDNPDQRKASQYMLNFQSPESEAALARDNFEALSRVFTDAQGKSLIDDEEMTIYKKAWSQPRALTGMLNYYRANVADFLSTARNDHKIDIKVPTLLLWGEADRYILPGNLVGLDEWATDLTLERFPGVSHWIAIERPEEVNKSIRRFLGA